MVIQLLGLCFLLLTSCSLHQATTPGGFDQALVQNAPLIKQKQKIALLEKKVQLAEKEQKKAEEEVEKLKRELGQAELILIQKQVNGFETQVKKIQTDPQLSARLLQIEASTLFLKEREILYQMIQDGPSPSAFEAQVMLDRILRMITELGDGVSR